MESELSEPGERETESFSDTAKASGSSNNIKKDPLRNILNIAMAERSKIMDCEENILDVDNTARDFSLCLIISEKTSESDVKNNNISEDSCSVFGSVKEYFSDPIAVGDALKTGGDVMLSESSNQPEVTGISECDPEKTPVKCDSDSSFEGFDFSPDSSTESLCTHASSPPLDLNDERELEENRCSTPDYYLSEDMEPAKSKKMRYMLTFEEANLPGPSSAGLIDESPPSDCSVKAAPDTIMPSLHNRHHTNKSRQKLLLINAGVTASSQSRNADDEGMTAHDMNTTLQIIKTVRRKTKGKKKAVKRNHGGFAINQFQDENVEEFTTDELPSSNSDHVKESPEKMSPELPCAKELNALTIKAYDHEEERKSVKRKLDVADIVEDSDSRVRYVPVRRDFSFEIDSVCEIHKGNVQSNVNVSSDSLPHSSENQTKNNSKQESSPDTLPSGSGENQTKNNSKQKRKYESVCVTQKVVRNLKTAFALLDKRYTEKMATRMAGQRAVTLPPSPESTEDEDDDGHSNDETYANFVIVDAPKLSLKTIRRSFRQRRAAKKLNRNCPVCGLSLLTGKLIDHFHEEKEKLSKLSLYVKDKKKRSITLKKDTNVNEKFKSVRARREERTLAKLFKLKPWVNAVCPACHARLSEPEDILNHAIIWSCPIYKSTEISESSEDCENPQLSAEIALQLSTVNCASVTRIINEDDDLSLDVEAGVEDEFGAQQYFGGDVHPQDASCPSKLAQLATSGDETSGKKSQENGSGYKEHANNKDIRANLDNETLGGNAEANMSDGEEQDNDNDDPRDILVANLKAKIRSLEAAHVSNSPRCAVCMGLFKTPVVSVVCWHILCEMCWLTVLRNTSLCPLCKVIVSPRQLRKVYL